jgi:hypothetical protein
MQLGFHDGVTNHRRGGCTDEDRSIEDAVGELYRRKANWTDRKTSRNGIKTHCEKRCRHYNQARQQNDSPEELMVFSTLRNNRRYDDLGIIVIVIGNGQANGSQTTD